MSAALLDAAFLATTYRVETPLGRFDLRIGVGDPAFEACLRGLGISRWVIVSAVNPGAMQLSAADNQLRQSRLLDRVTVLGYRFFAAVNLPDANDWPPEPAFCLLQIDEAQGCALAREFSQLAVVCGDTGAVSRLVWT